MKIRPLFILFCVLVLVAQKVIFSDALMVVANQYPLMIFVLPLIILALPINFDKPLLLISAFLIGLTLDIFNDTLGINTFALVMMAYFRSSILNLVQPRQGYKTDNSGYKSYGIGWISIYLGVCLFIFSFTFFMIDAFTLVYLKRVLISSAMSTLVSLPFGVLLLMIFKA
ncbi:MAG: hypothetical protein P8M34_03545 [Saprospiraceae bacterium]|nr:hypothetical protein [Saprospiraceae bacterium]|tara:strand:- start:1569 stop:2078 length:510 start_codon:yes stop_codon:yes gene_type:complete